MHITRRRNATVKTNYIFSNLSFSVKFSLVKWHLLLLGFNVDEVSFSPNFYKLFLIKVILCFLLNVCTIEKLNYRQSSGCPLRFWKIVFILWSSESELPIYEIIFQIELN